MTCTVRFSNFTRHLFGLAPHVTKKLRGKARSFLTAAKPVHSAKDLFRFNLSLSTPEHDRSLSSVKMFKR